jgi:hypothetical protein
MVRKDGAHPQIDSKEKRQASTKEEAEQLPAG